MADEKTESTEATAETAEAKSETAKSKRAAPEAAEPTALGTGPEGGPVPGDPSTEPVATAAQSHVVGRVGPPTIAQDSDATWHTPEGVEQIAPGSVAPANTAPEGGAIPTAPLPAELGAGPYGGETPAPAAANVVTQSTPGTDLPTAEELPAGTPVPSNESASGGPVTSPPTGTSATAPDSSGSSTTTPAETSDSAGSKPSAS